LPITFTGVKFDVILDMKFHVDEGDEKAQTNRVGGEYINLRGKK
jgi:hypothetical protein